MSGLDVLADKAVQQQSTKGPGGGEAAGAASGAGAGAGAGGKAGAGAGAKKRDHNVAFGGDMMAMQTMQVLLL